MDLQNKSITISGVQSTDKKIILLQDKEKYYFWITKKDGNHTTAYDQFQKFRFNAGDKVEIAVKEEEKMFRNEKGQNITFMDRNIAYFVAQDDFTPKQPIIPKTPENPVATPNIALEEKIEALEKRVGSLEMMFNAKKDFIAPVEDATVDGELIPF